MRGLLKDLARQHGLQLALPRVVVALRRDIEASRQRAQLASITIFMRFHVSFIASTISSSEAVSAANSSERFHEDCSSI